MVWCGKCRDLMQRLRVYGESCRYVTSLCSVGVGAHARPETQNRDRH